MPDVTVETTNVDQLKSAVLSVDLNRLHFLAGQCRRLAALFITPKITRLRIVQQILKKTTYQCQ